MEYMEHMERKMKVDVWNETIARSRKQEVECRNKYGTEI